MSNIENFRDIVIYSQNQEFEPHPLKFLANTHPDDINHLVRETIENIKTHINNSNLKVWDPSQESEVNHHTEDLYNYASLLLSETKPGSSFGGSGVSTINQSPNRKRVEAHLKDLTEQNQVASSDYDSIKRTKGPIVADKAEKNSIILQPSSDIVQPKRKSAAKIYLDGRGQNPTTNRTSEMNNVHNAMQSEAHFLENIGVKQNQNATDSYVTTQKENADQRNVGCNNTLNEGTGTLNQKEKDQIFQISSQDNNIESHFSKKEVPKPPTGTIGIRNIDGDDPNIYSFKTSIMPFSYMIQAMTEKFQEKTPPPVYLPNELLCDKKQYSKTDVFYGLEITPTGELKLVDPEILKQQKGLITEVLQSLMKSIAEGRGVVGVSLPIRIFEARSLIERVCDFWTFIPNNIVPAVQLTNPLERIKKLITALVSGLHLNAKQLKPFNPLLGETFQGIFPQHGITIDLEHTSHHPPIANYLLTHKDFRLWGRYEFIAKLEGLTKNTVLMLQEGISHLEFSDGHKILFTCPYLHLEGMMHGARTAKFCGVLRIIDEANKIKVIVKFGETGDHKQLPKKRTDVFYGKIYKYKDLESKGNKKVSDLNFGDMESSICDIYGTWLEYLNIGGIETWNIERDAPTPFFPVKDPLPSDARFREDLIWVKRNNKKYAQDWKLILEVRQRLEKKLRIEGYKHLHSKKKH